MESEIHGEESGIPFLGELAPEDLRGSDDLDHECVACGCTDRASCEGGCFWTYRFSIDHPLGMTHPLAGFGLCSRCAALPFNDLAIKIRIRHKSIVMADLQRRGLVR